MDRVGRGEGWTLILHEQTDRSTPYEGLFLEDDRTVALIAASGELPLVRQVAALDGATLLVDRLDFESALSAQADSANLVIDRSFLNNVAITDSFGLIRNSFIDAFGTDRDALNVQGSSDVDLIYTTILGRSSSPLGISHAILCLGPDAHVSLRNGLVARITARSSAPLFDCSNLSVSHSVLPIDWEGQGIVVVDDSDPAPWFTDAFSGDLHLTASAPDVVLAAAQWQTGDPEVDVDGQPRPSSHGSFDAAGADLP